MTQNNDNTNETSVLAVFLLTFLMATMSGLGSLPFFFVPRGKKLSETYAGLANAIACGVMLAASFDMVHEGEPYGPGLVCVGLFFGASFIAFLQQILRAYEDVSFASLVGADARKTLLVVGIMTAHSFGEGSGVGVSFSGVHGWAQGCLVTFAIGVHNIPEGLAVSTVLASKGVKPMQCLFWSIVSSLPQTITAVPSFMFVESFQSMLPFGVGFSAGCMIWIVFAELLPDAFEGVNDARAVATAATMSAAALEGFRMAMQQLDNEDGTLRTPTLKDFGLGNDNNNNNNNNGDGRSATFYLALAPAFIASFSLFLLKFTNKKGALLVERLFRDKMRRNDEVDNIKNGDKNDVLKSQPASKNSKISVTLGIASGILVIQGTRALFLTLRAIYYGGFVEILFATTGVFLARFVLLRVPKLVFLNNNNSNNGGGGDDGAPGAPEKGSSGLNLSSLTNGWDAIDGAFEAFIVSITCVSLSILDGVRFASAAESLDNVRVEFPACIRALLRTAPAALSAFSCKAGNASELALRASMMVGSSFFSSSIIASKFLKHAVSEKTLTKHIENYGEKNLFKIEGLLEAASLVMCAYAFHRALWPRALRETRGSADEQAGLMLGLTIAVAANVALFALALMTPYKDSL